MHKESPQRRKLREWVAAQLKSRLPGYRFPTDKQLAANYSISVRTVARIFKEFRGNGTVWRIPGKGTMIPFSDDAATGARDLTAPISSVESIEMAVFNSICIGELKQGTPLPSIKFMCRQVRASSRSVVGAYRNLERRGVITRIGKTFWAGPLGSVLSDSAVKETFLFMCGSDDFSGVFKHDFMSSAYQHMQDELEAHGYMVILERAEALERLSARWKSARRYPYGLIFSRMTGEIMETLIPALRALVRDAAELMPPVLVDWISGDFTIIPPAFHIISRGNILTVASRALAIHIMEKGYRSASVFSDQVRQGQTWTFPDIIRIRSELKRMNRNFEFSLVVKPGRNGSTGENFIAENFVPDVLRLLNKFKSFALNRVAEEIKIVKDFSPAFSSAKPEGIWVFTHADDAAAALDWAAGHAIAVPQDLSIITLENNPLFYNRGLSFCGPDWSRIGCLMAHLIINHIPTRKSSRGFIVTYARIARRLTTR